MLPIFITSSDIIRRYQNKLVESSSRMQQIQDLRKQCDLFKLKADSAEEQLSQFLKTKDDMEKVKDSYELRIQNLESRAEELLNQVESEKANVQYLRKQLQGKQELASRAETFDRKMKEMENKVFTVESKNLNCKFKLVLFASFFKRRKARSY